MWPIPTRLNPSMMVSYSYNACRLPYNLVQSKDRSQSKNGEKDVRFLSMSQRNLYAGYDLKGKALNNHQAASFPWHQ